MKELTPRLRTHGSYIGMSTMDDTHPENDVRVDRQRWSEACDSMVESSPKRNA
jgi:hypothetical protein